jgi:hypothetical protein
MLLRFSQSIACVLSRFSQFIAFPKGKRSKFRTLRAWTQTRATFVLLELLKQQIDPKSRERLLIALMPLIG